MGRTIIVSNRLPIKIINDNGSLTYAASEGGLATGLDSVFKSGNNLWVGWPGIALDDNKKSEVTKTLKTVASMMMQDRKWYVTLHTCISFVFPQHLR